MHNDALLDEAECYAAEVRAARAKVDASDKVLGPGPVYQGVSKAIRVLTASGKGYADRVAKIDADECAGLIALARSTARAVDRMTGHNPSGWVANGRDLAPVVAELRETLSALGSGEDVDPLQAWLDADDAPADVVRS